jgi:hypothetical protein
MWFARSTKLAWDLSSLYVPAGGGAIADGAAVSAARDKFPRMLRTTAAPAVLNRQHAFEIVLFTAVYSPQ